MFNLHTKFKASLFHLAGHTIIITIKQKGRWKRKKERRKKEGQEKRRERGKEDNCTRNKTA